MAVFRVEKTRDYTVMANHHLRNTALSLKAKGLLSLMLSLPDDWDYTLKGLARICRDGVDSIAAAVNELEEAGYIVRQRVRDNKGRVGEMEYTILERPNDSTSPKRDFPIQENPVQENPAQEKPEQEKRPQLNTKESNIQQSSIERSNPILSNHTQICDRIGTDEMQKREQYRELLKENIEYDILTDNSRLDRERIDELLELMTDTVCTNRKTLRIAGDDYPAEVVKSRLLKLNSMHIEYVLDCMAKNTTEVRNIKKYLLAALYNAPATMDSYCTCGKSHAYISGALLSGIDTCPVHIDERDA